MNKLIPILFSAAALLSASDVRTDREVLSAVNSFKQAVVAKDRPALERLLHPDLTYGHTDGHLETKAQVLDRVTDPKVNYSAIDVSDAAVRVYGQVALVTAKLAFHIKANGAESVADLTALDVWIKGPKGWQLAGRQLTRPPK